MPTSKYTVTAAQPWMYLDDFQRTVKGFRVYFKINAYNETHYVEVPSLEKEVIRAKIDKIVADRDSLNQL